MDDLTFISNLVQYLAVPFSALIGLAIILRNIPNFVKFIKSIKYKDIEVNLRDAFLEAQTTATEISISRTASDVIALTDEAEHPDKILQLADIDPAVAISEIWRTVQTETIKLIQHNGLMRFTRPDIFIKWLVENDKITRGEAALFFQLRKIRNDVVHGFSNRRVDVSLAEVLEFKSFADLFIQKLASIRAEPGFLNYPMPLPEGSTR